MNLIHLYVISYFIPQSLVVYCTVLIQIQSSHISILSCLSEYTVLCSWYCGWFLTYNLSNIFQTSVIHNNCKFMIYKSNHSSPSQKFIPPPIQQCTYISSSFILSSIIFPIFVLYIYCCSSFNMSIFKISDQLFWGMLAYSVLHVPMVTHGRMR